MPSLASWLTRLRRRPEVTTAVRRRAYGPTLDYARAPEPGWQAALDAATLVGDGTQVGRLVLHWVAGDPWQPVHRWLLFQCQPWAYVPDTIKRELRGPHPRTHARLEYVPRVIDGKALLRPAVRGGPCRLIDRTQWVLHRQLERETGQLVFPRYCWVIQGNRGGHPFQVSDSEQQLRRAQGLPADVPSVGDLPYAPFDGRVLAALERYDLWRWAHGLGDPQTAAATARIARQVATEREANRALWATKEAVAAEVADGMAHAARRDGLHYHRWTPVGAPAARIDFDAQREAYIHDTTLEAGR